MENWWKNNAYISKIVNWGFELAEQYPGKQLIALGQSPAWNVYAAGRIRKRSRGKAGTAYIPFTGCFLEREQTDNDQNTMAFRTVNRNAPEKGIITSYFNYLNSGGLTPQHVIEEYENGRKTVLLDMIREGKGMASFLSVWTQDLDEQSMTALKEALILHVYDVNPQANRDNIKIFGNAEMVFPLTRTKLYGEDQDIIQNIAPINKCTADSSRLVPLYRLTATPCHGAGLEICGNQHVTRKIQMVLQEKIQRQESLHAFPG